MSLRQQLKQSSEEVTRLQSKTTSLENVHKTEVSLLMSLADLKLSWSRKTNS